MINKQIELELEKIDSITALGIDYGGDAVINMECTLTLECVRRLENTILKDLREQKLESVGIRKLTDYINHISRTEFNRQLAEMGYTMILTKEKSAELFDIVDRRK